jgi:hypothetical protein
MCQAFSCLVTSNRKVTWKFGVDSHSELLKLAGFKDQTADPKQMMFARVEVTPDNRDYINPDNWTLRVDESIRPAWFSMKHEESCLAARNKWSAQLEKFIVRQPIINPLKKATPKVTKKHIALLKEWDSVRDSVGASVRDSVWASVGASVGASVRDSVWASVGDSVWASVRDSVGASVGASVRDSVWASVRDSVRAYTGSFFRPKEWKCVKHARGEYPFQPCVDLWKAGLAPSFDGTTWRLHGGPNAEIVFSITAVELRGKSAEEQK